MAHALTPAPLSSILETHASLNFTGGDVQYQIQREGDQVVYRVRRGAENLSLLIQWAFGIGNTGQTYVYLKDGALYEARVSFYRSRNGLDITNGHKDLPETTLTEAAGRLLSEEETSRCFGCHSSPGGVDFIPGVQCSACHEQSEEHAASFSGGRKIIQPLALRTLNSLELANLCGRCHRTYAQINTFGPKSVQNVRFQPYRLISSRCFNANDERISCIACHNPHIEVQKSASFYDAKCKACHAGRPSVKKTDTVLAARCPVAQQNCTSCHMPKVKLPEMHDAFTDHRIRIVRPGASYPS